MAAAGVPFITVPLGTALLIYCGMLGARMAERRERHPVLWFLAGCAFPPVLLVLRRYPVTKPQIPVIES